ncbi:restriction endonuclease subunit S [Orbus sturtevantii]|uniref:restriction endonuclease subunit S n=1 Tax=Orbus sturtevantii TaxID=3074109 RepID=UPI00370D13FD
MRVDKMVPEIRFRKSSGKWIQENISNVAPLQRGFDLPKSEMNAGVYPVVMSNGVNGFHNAFQAKAPGVVTGRSGTIGNIHYIDVDYWPHNTSLWVTNFYKNVPLFIYYLYIKLDIKKFGTGSGVPTLNRNDVHDQLVAFPKDEKEQTAIGNYFQKLDSLINQHQQKHDKLSNIKKAMLEKMFPKQGETIPEIRFKGFSDEWKETVLSEIVNKYDNLRIAVTTKDRIAGIIPYYGANGIQDYVEGYTHDGEYILLAEDGANDLKHYPIHYVNGKVWVNNHAHVLKAKEDNSNIFLKYALNNVDFEPFLVGGGRAKLNAGVMMNLELIISTDTEEQLAIGNYFQKLDALINQHQQQITKLNNIKQACLSKMFV